MRIARRLQHHRRLISSIIITTQPSGNFVRNRTAINLRRRRRRRDKCVFLFVRGCLGLCECV